VRDHEPQETLFDLLSGYLSLLDGATARPAALRAFELGALREAGLAPMLGACAHCGTPIDPQARAFRFDPAQGGVLCPACPPAAAPGASVLSAATLAALVRLQDGGLAAADEEPLLPPAGREARDALGAFVSHHLGHALVARRFIDQIGPMLDP
jgi:DNA repair protein RecO (recombination protein O)